MTQSEQILAFARTHRMLRAADLRSHGWSPQLLAHLHAAGQLQRVARGVYSLPDAPVTEHQSLVEACQRVPDGVVCLLSALQFHAVGTQSPHEVWLAVREGRRTPAAGYPVLRVARMRGPAYQEGIETTIDRGAPIRVYGIAKTVADCFKFRHKIGLDVALEALADAWRQRRIDTDALAHFARIDRVEHVMQPYLEAVAA